MWSLKFHFHPWISVEEATAKLTDTNSIINLKKRNKKNESIKHKRKTRIKKKQREREKSHRHIFPSKSRTKFFILKHLTMEFFFSINKLCICIATSLYITAMWKTFSLSIFHQFLSWVKSFSEFLYFFFNIFDFFFVPFFPLL